MLWSYWRIKCREVVVPRRFPAYRTRAAAVGAATAGTNRARRRHAIVALILREHGGDQVVPEFNVRAVGEHFNLLARWDVDHFVVSGEVPRELWYEEERT